MPTDTPVQITTTIPQSFIIEALGGPTHPTALLDRFPDAIYLKSPESHLVRFVYALLGPAGVGKLAKDYLEARLVLEEIGIELFDLDGFFGDPFSFGRIFDEYYDEPATDLLSSDAQERIRARDSRYRNRALDYLGGVRLGNSPTGMRIVAKAGLGHDVELVENYKYLYDLHSDQPRGYPYFGQTASIMEMIVLPRQELSRSEVQIITIYGSPTGGYLTLTYNGRTDDPVDFVTVPHDAPARGDWDVSNPSAPVLIMPGVQEVLEAHRDIGKGNVRVSGGPGPDNPWVVEFIGDLSSRDVPEIEIYGDDPNKGLTGGDPLSTADVATTVGGVDSSNEIVSIAARDLHHLQEAVDRIKAVTTIPTVASASGTRSVQRVNRVFATSELIEVVRYVTGNPAVPWPALDATHWIQRNVEREAPRPFSVAKQHYQGFHSPVALQAYTDDALQDPALYETGTVAGDVRSEHIGQFHPAQTALYSALIHDDSDLRFTADRAPADYPEQPVVGRLNTAGDVPLILGIYPIDYANLAGVPVIRYRDEQFWASRERTSGDDYLEIDLGSVQVVNFLAFETLRKPVELTIACDRLDQAPRRIFDDVVAASENYPSLVGYTGDAGWTYLEFHFGADPIYTRFLRVKLSRRILTPVPFLYDEQRGVANPWSVEVKNLRVGRNVSN
jgi:hypothetical protein